MYNLIANRKSILIAFIVLMFFHLAFTFSGFYGNDGSDDINYAKFAAGILSDETKITPAEHHYHELRWSVIYTTAIFYKFFGIGEIPSALTSFIAFALCGFLLFKMTAGYKPTDFILVLVLFFFSRSIIFYQHRLLPDPIMCFAVLWMYYSYREYTIRKNNPAGYILQFTLAFVLALTTKETIIIIFPLFLFFMIRDIIRRNHLQFWKYGVSAVVLVVFMYLLYFKLTTGTFFYRHQLIQSGSYFSICSFDQLPSIYTLRRIGYELWRAMLLNGDLLVLLPAICAVIYRRKFSGYFNMNDISAFIVLLLSSNFMSISYTSYVPLCQDPRHFLFLIPIGALLGAPMLTAFFRNPEKFGLLPVFYLLATIVMFLLKAGGTKYLYLLFAALTIGYYLLYITFKHQLIFWAALWVSGIILFFNYAMDFVKPLYPWYYDHKKLIREYFTEKNTAITVVSADLLSAELSEFFLGFNTGNIKFISAGTKMPIKDSSIYYLLNRGLNTVESVKLDSVLLSADAGKIQLVRKENNVCLYSVNPLLLPVLRND